MGGFFFLLYPTLVGSTDGWHECIIGAWSLTVVEIGQGCPVSRPIAYRGVALGGRGHNGEGGPTSGSVSRLISRCHSATVGSRREGQPRSTQESAGSVGKTARKYSKIERTMKPIE